MNDDYLDTEECLQCGFETPLHMCQACDCFIEAQECDDYDGLCRKCYKNENEMPNL